MNETRRELLLMLAEIGTLYPEMRLGQIISWLAGVARGSAVEAIYDVEDNELIAAIRDHISNPLARSMTSDTPNLRNSASTSSHNVDAQEVLRELEGRLGADGAES